MDTYQFRIIESNDIEDVTQLLKSVFKIWPPVPTKSTPENYFKWLYLENPHQKHGKAPVPFTVVGIHDTKIIGVINAVTYDLKIGNKITIGSYGADFAIHKDYRGKGLSGKLRKTRDTFRDQFVKVSVGMSSSKLLIDRNKRLGAPEFPHEPHTYVRIKDIDFHFEKTGEKSISKRLGYLGVKSLNKLFKEKKHEVKNLVSTINHFDERYDRFWENIMDEYKYIIVRKQDYLNWRYCDPRGGNYIVREVVENDEVVGFCVLAVNNLNLEYPIGVIVDLLSLPGRSDVVRDLLLDAVEYFDNIQCNLVKIRFVKNHPFTQVVNEIGFVDSRVNPYITFQSYGEPLAEINDVYESSPHEVH